MQPVTLRKVHGCEVKSNGPAEDQCLIHVGLPRGPLKQWQGMTCDAVTEQVSMASFSSLCHKVRFMQLHCQPVGQVLLMDARQTCSCGQLSGRHPSLHNGFCPWKQLAWSPEGTKLCVSGRDHAATIDFLRRRPSFWEKR